MTRNSLQVLTGENSWHECREHEEEHTEEKTAGVVVGLARFITDAQVEQADQDPYR